MVSLRNFKTIGERRAFIEKERNVRLDAVSVFPDGLKEASKRNCENMIGAVSLPLGVAGPMTIHGDYAKGAYFIPLATTEAALVASVSRGCKAISQAGGAIVRLEDVGMTRGPVFQTTGIVQGRKFIHWLTANMKRLNEVASETSSHVQLVRILPSQVGTYVFVRFSFTTQEAMGMNMVTIATQRIVETIEKEIGITCVSVAGNFDVDKKPAWLNFTEGRGKRIWAEARISADIVARVLKTTPEAIQRIAAAKCLGSIMSGSLGFNAHYANIVAAVYIATGQDAAHVVEGSLGITTTDIDNTQLYIAVYLPDIAVGTVGGGMHLPAQKEALTLLGVYEGDEKKRVLKFAEVLGGAVLSGELSLLASLAEGSLARAHERLGRGKTSNFK